MSLFFSTLSLEEVEREYEKLRELQTEGFINQDEYLRRVQQLNQQLDVVPSPPATEEQDRVREEQPPRKRKRSSEDTRRPSRPKTESSPRPERAERSELSEQRDPNRAIYGIKHWVGFPVSDIAFETAVSQLGGRCPSPHFSLGWCQLSTELNKFYSSRSYDAEALQTLQAICKLMGTNFILCPAKFELLGKHKDKVTVVYKAKAVGNKGPINLEAYNKDILEIWRNVARDFAKQTNSKFATVRVGGLEKGFVDGILVYQMRAIELKLHLTVGQIDRVASDLGEGLRKNYLGYAVLKKYLKMFPTLTVKSQGAYISAGSTIRIN
jgi:hypothetical protein